jgi:arylsulfatase A
VVAEYAVHPAADPDVNRPALAAMVEQMDAAIGRLLAVLRAAGRERDTLVVFTADHGPMGASERRKPLRGAKADLYEGGVRVPLLLRWPEGIAAGQVRDAIVSGMDVFPTVLTACDVPVAETVDGLSLWPVIRDGSRPLAREASYWHYPHYHHLGLGPCGAIRMGEYKLLEWFRPAPVYELFNLATDPGETRNLAAVEPERCDALLRCLREWRRSVGAQEMQPNPVYDPAAPTRLLPPVGDEVRLKDS